MTLKFLNECLDLHNGRRDKSKQLQWFREQMDNTSITEDPKIYGGEIRDRVGNVAARIIELEGDISLLDEKLGRARDRISAWASTLPTQQERVICSRYVDGLSWEKVSEKCFYSQNPPAVGGRGLAGFRGTPKFRGGCAFSACPRRWPA